MNKFIFKLLNIRITIILVIFIAIHINYGLFSIETAISSSLITSLKGKYVLVNKSYLINDSPINK